MCLVQTHGRGEGLAADGRLVRGAAAEGKLQKYFDKGAYFCFFLTLINYLFISMYIHIDFKRKGFIKFHNLIIKTAVFNTVA